MCPMVRRRIKTEVGSTFSEVESDHELYVKPGREKPKDKVIPPAQLDDARLGDLVTRHPKEYGVEHAKRVKEVKKEMERNDLDQLEQEALETRLRQLLPEFAEENEGDEPDDSSDEFDGDEAFQPDAVQEEFLKLDEKAAIAAIRKEENQDTLALWLDAEDSSGRKRPKVVREFARKGEA